MKSVSFAGQVRRLPKMSAVSAVCLAIAQSLVPLALAQSGPVIVSDAFNRADSSALGVADTGQAWTAHYGAIGISSGKATPGSGFVLASLDGGTTQGNAEVRVSAVSDEFWLIIRLQNDANYWRFGRWRGEPYQLQQVVANAIGSPQIQTGATLTPQAGDVLKCALLSPGLRCSVNNTVVATTADTFGAAATRVGLSGYLSSNARFDDLLVTGISGPDLTVRLTGPSSALAGSAVNWVATLRNEGNAPASSPQLQVTPPAGVTNLSISGATCSYNGTLYTCPFTSLAPQAEVAVTITLASAAGPSVVISANAPPVAGETDNSQNSASFTTVIQTPPPAGAIVSDTFGRTNGSVLGTADTGQQWVAFYDPMTISQGQAAPSAGFSLTALDAGASAIKTSVAVPQISQEFWLIVRLQDGQNYWRFGRWQGQPYQLQQIVQNGLASPAITTLATLTPSAGDTLSCTSTQAFLECSVNGAAIARTTVSTGNTATRVGLSAYQAGSARFDNFAVTQAVAAAELSVTLTGPAISNANTAASWTASVHNTGTVAAQGVEVVLNAPASVTQPILSGASCVNTGSSWRCPLGTMAAGQTASVRLDGVTPAATGYITLTASVPPQNGEVQISDNTASVSTYVHDTTGGTVLLFDSFDRADSASLGIATTGQTWTAHSAGLGIAAGLAAAGSGFTLSSVDAGSATVNASIKLTAPAPEFWLVMRFVDAQNYWRFGRSQNQAYQLQQIVQNNLGTPAVTLLNTVQPAAGDTLSCRSTNQLLECSVNGVVVVRTSATGGSSATRLGLSTYQSTAARFDGLLVTQPLGAPDLSVALTGSALVSVNTSTSWTATVRNLGATSVPSLSITFNVPPSLSQAAITGASCTAGGSTWTCPIGTLAAGQTVSLRLDATTPSTTGTVAISASAPLQNGEVESANNTATFSTYVHNAGSGSLRVFDSFDRPDSASLGTATSGQPWTVHAGAFGVANGYAQPGDAGTLASIESGSLPLSVSASLASPASEFWLVVRMQDTQNYWRFGRRLNQAYELQQIVGNTLGTPAVSTFGSVTPAAGDSLSCATSEQLIECAVNGVAVAQATVSGGSPTRVGLSAYQGSAARFDNFLVTQLSPLDLAITLNGPAVSAASAAATWTASVQNVSEGAAQNVTAVFTLPPSLTQVAITGASCASTGSTRTCTLGSLAAGQTVTLTLNATTPAGSGHITVAASVPPHAGESLVANNSAQVSTYVHSAADGILKVYDSFDRPHAATLGTATTGQAWTTHTGSYGTADNGAASGSSFALASLDTGVAPETVSVTLATPGREFWLVLRLQDSQNYWRFGRRENEPYQLQLVRGNAIGVAAIDTLATVTPAAGDVLSCSIQMEIDCAVNGTVVAITADTTGQTATRVGLSVYESASVRFDDLLVVVPPPAPNLAVHVIAPRHALAGQSHTAEVTVQNIGASTSGTGTVVVTPPSWVTVVSRPPQCAPQGSGFACPVPALAASVIQSFIFTLSSGDAEPFTGRAEIIAPGDSYYDNVANWTTWVHNPGSVIDNFNRTNTASGLGTAATQQSWTSLTPGFHISGNQAQADTAGAMAVVNPGYAFGTMEVVMGSAASTTGLVFRVANATNYYRLAADESGFYAVRKIVNGVVSPLQFGIVRANVRPSPGDVVRLMTRPDDGVFVAVNGQQILDLGDPEAMYQAGWGIVSVGGPASVDDLAIDPRLVGYPTTDNFDRPDGTLLRTPTTGSKYQWKPWIGEAWVSQAGRATPTSTGYTYTWVDVASEQGNAQVKLAALGQGGWLMFRYDEFSDTYFRFGQQAGAYTLQFMYREVVRTMPVTVQTLASPTPQAGDVVRVTQRTNGTVECSVNGVITHRFVDTTVNARWTLYGLASQGTQAAFDDFQVTPFSH